MGVFFSAARQAPGRTVSAARGAGAPGVPGVAPTVEWNPGTESGVVEQHAQEVVGDSPVRKFLWGRFLVAGSVLLLLFAAIVYTAHDDKLAEFSKTLTHSFELLFGGFLGLLTGESQNK